MAENNVKIESITTNDGRRAEKHSSVDANGNEIIEIFAEEVRPLKLEKRIVREKKEVVAKEIHQLVKDGEVTYEEVLSNDVEVPLKVIEKIATADHSKVVSGDYVKKEDLPAMISDGVVAGITALMQTKNATNPDAFFKAQSVLENNVKAKKTSKTVYIVTALIVVNIIITAVVYTLN